MKGISYLPMVRAKQVKHIIGAKLTIIMGIIFVIVGGLIGQLYTFIPAPDPYRSSLMLMFTFGLTSALIWIWAKFREGRTLGDLGLPKANALKEYLIGSGIGILMYALVMVFLFITGSAVINPSPKFITGLAAIPTILVLIPGWMVQSGTEELLVRGWMMSTLGAKLSMLTSAVLSSMFFTFLHSGNSNVTVIAIINIAIIGFLYALMSFYYGNIWAACGAHFTWNFFQGNIFGCPVSGQVFGNASLLSTDLVGNPIITGGGFGPEAGIASSVVLILFTLYYGYKLRQNGN